MEKHFDCNAQDIRKVDGVWIERCGSTKGAVYVHSLRGGAGFCGKHRPEILRCCPECGQLNEITNPYCGGCETRFTHFEEIQKILGDLEETQTPEVNNGS